MLPSPWASPSGPCPATARAVSPVHACSSCRTSGSPVPPDSWLGRACPLLWSLTQHHVSGLTCLPPCQTPSLRGLPTGGSRHPSMDSALAHSRPSVLCAEPPAAQAGKSRSGHLTAPAALHLVGLAPWTCTCWAWLTGLLSLLGLPPAQQLAFVYVHFPIFPPFVTPDQDSQPLSQHWSPFS